MLSDPSRPLCAKRVNKSFPPIECTASAWVAASLVNMSVGAVLMMIPSSWQRLSWKRTLRARKSSETRRNVSRMSVPSSSAGSSARPNSLNGGTSAKAIGTSCSVDRTELKLVDHAPAAA